MALITAIIQLAWLPVFFLFFIFILLYILTHTHTHGYLGFYNNNINGRCSPADDSKSYSATEETVATVAPRSYNSLAC